MSGALSFAAPAEIAGQTSPNVRSVARDGKGLCAQQHQAELSGPVTVQKNCAMCGECKQIGVFRLLRRGTRHSWCRDCELAYNRRREAMRPRRRHRAGAQPIAEPSCGLHTADLDRAAPAFRLIREWRTNSRALALLRVSVDPLRCSL
jgi:hypothetical protein